MSDLPEQKLYKNDIVIHSSTEHSGGYMGVVEEATWDPFLRSYNYQYTCQYMTDTIKGSNTIWTKVFDCPKWAYEYDLEKVGRKADSQGQGGESQWPRAGIEA